MKDTFDRFQPSQRGRFGDNETIRGNDSVRSDLCDLDLILHNDNPGKQAIAVSLSPDTPFEKWAWLPRSLIEYEATGIGKDRKPTVRVTLPEAFAKEKGLI